MSEINTNHKMMTEGGAGDMDLIARLQSRDASAMEELYDRYGRLVYVQILRMVRDVSLTEDLVQQTFLRAWNRANSLEPERRSIRPWLMAVARNHAIDYLRSTRWRPDESVEFDEASHSPAQNTEQQFLAADLAGVLKTAMQNLLPNQHRAIELAYFEGLSHSETAERMGQPLGTVKTWVRMGLKNLRAELAPRMTLSQAIL
jgi:RNA polymerase sigma-70 factor (ECF subfamily)